MGLSVQSINGAPPPAPVVAEPPDPDFELLLVPPPAPVEVLTPSDPPPDCELDCVSSPPHAMKTNAPQKATLCHMPHLVSSENRSGRLTQ
jgi:hypothetical protein